MINTSMPGSDPHYPVQHILESLDAVPFDKRKWISEQANLLIPQNNRGLAPADRILQGSILRNLAHLCEGEGGQNWFTQMSDLLNIRHQEFSVKRTMTHLLSEMPAEARLWAFNIASLCIHNALVPLRQNLAVELLLFLFGIEGDLRGDSNLFREFHNLFALELQRQVAQAPRMVVRDYLLLLTEVKNQVLA
jgi:hypothetical protein